MQEILNVKNVSFLHFVLSFEYFLAKQSPKFCLSENWYGKSRKSNNCIQGQYTWFESAM